MRYLMLLTKGTKDLDSLILADDTKVIGAWLMTSRTALDFGLEIQRHGAEVGIWPVGDGPHAPLEYYGTLVLQLGEDGAVCVEHKALAMQAMTRWNLPLDGAAWMTEN